MARDPIVDRRARAIRIATVTLVWLVGLAAALFGALGASARYGCSAGDRGLACRSSGSVIGLLVVVVVVVVVTAVTLFSRGRDRHGMYLLGGFGLLALGCCLAAALVLLGTT